MTPRLRLVVVNDDPSSLKMLTSMLSGQYVVVPFLSPIEALNYLEEHPVPDALLTDLHMPELDGWSFCRLLKSTDSPWKQMPIVLLSAFASGIDAEEISRELGAKGFISLPQPPFKLVQQLQHLLSGGVQPPPRYALCTSSEAKSLRAALQSVLEESGVVAEQYDSLAALEADLPAYQAVLFSDDLPGLEEALVRLDRPERSTVILVLSLDRSLTKAQNLVVAGADAVLNHGFSVVELTTAVKDAHRARALLRIPDLERSGEHRPTSKE